MNFTFHPNYATATESDIEVKLIWSSEVSELDSNNDELVVDHTIVISDHNGFMTNHTSKASNITVMLQFNTVYSIILYSSICGRMSDPYHHT